MHRLARLARMVRDRGTWLGVAVLALVLAVGSGCGQQRLAPQPASASSATFTTEAPSTTAAPTTTKPRPTTTRRATTTSRRQTTTTRRVTTTRHVTPTTAAPARNCDPAYPDACLHDGIGDYDCAGGSGNGPNYVRGPIRVRPPDPFGLDRDGDGYGCES